MSTLLPLGVVLTFVATQAAFSQASSTGVVADETLHTLTALLDGKTFVQIPPGEFLMGSPDGNPDEQPPRKIQISKGFQLGKIEVTQAQWDAVMRNPHGGPGTEEDRSAVNPSHFKGPSRPVENVSWDDVQQFLQRLNKRDPQHLYRLPTEAEWEYACRAGEADAAGRAPEEAAWFTGNANRQTHPVGRKQPNAWGLQDMLGNVFEWVQDWYAPDAYTAGDNVDPAGPESSSYKVYRGCAWLSEAKQCRPAFRGFDFPNSPSYAVGFRLVRTAR
jgi:formylglycine-generating enzyme required for sulfatase activity